MNKREESLKLARYLLRGVVHGRSNVTIDGYTVGFDEDRQELFVRQPARPTIWMPAKYFVEFMTEEEVEDLWSLPLWNGNNEYVLTFQVMGAVQAAIKRYRACKKI